MKLDINIVPSKTKLKNESGYWPMLSALVIVWLTEMSSAKKFRLIADKKNVRLIYMENMRSAVVVVWKTEWALQKCRTNFRE